MWTTGLLESAGCVLSSETDIALSILKAGSEQSHEDRRRDFSMRSCSRQPAPDTEHNLDLKEGGCVLTHSQFRIAVAHLPSYRNQRAPTVAVHRLRKGTERDRFKRWRRRDALPPRQSWSLFNGNDGGDSVQTHIFADLRATFSG